MCHVREIPTTFPWFAALCGMVYKNISHSFWDSGAKQIEIEIISLWCSCKYQLLEHKKSALV